LSSFSSVLFFSHSSGFCCRFHLFHFSHFDSFYFTFFFSCSIRLFFIQAQRFGAKVWRNNFQVRLFFIQAQRFGAKVWRNNSQEAPRSQKAPKIFLPKVFKPAKTFFLACFIFKERYAKSQMQCPYKRTGAKAKISKQG
jgi:hypothetical protein